MNVNVSVAVGFAALFGVSIMNGVLIVQRITALRESGLGIDAAIQRGAGELLRPIVMASLVAMLGLLPRRSPTAWAPTCNARWLQSSCGACSLPRP